MDVGPPGRQSNASRPGVDADLSLSEILQHALAAPAHRRRLPAHHWKVFNALRACRTGALGAHRYRCQNCGREHVVPHACRNRHCPGCQGAAGADWFERQRECLLPVAYFHTVFTLPHSLNPLIRQNQKELYALLFQSASSTLLDFGKNNWRAKIGLTAVLHTWGQTLIDHYHLHCIVAAGGVSLEDGRWIQPSQRFLFSVTALSEVFRARFLNGLRKLFDQGKLVFHGKILGLARAENFEKLLAQAARPKWVVYSKRPFAGPEVVLKYLSRYTHRVGITHRRLKAHDPARQTVSFDYKDYADGARPKNMTLTHDEFVRRLALHILPPRFVRIRHYGFLANRGRAQRIERLKERLGSPELPPSKTTEGEGATPEPLRCPHCRQLGLKLVAIERGPARNKAPPCKP